MEHIELHLTGILLGPAVAAVGWMVVDDTLGLETTIVIASLTTLVLMPLCLGYFTGLLVPKEKKKTTFTNILLGTIVVVTVELHYLNLVESQHLKRFSDHLLWSLELPSVIVAF